MRPQHLLTVSVFLVSLLASPAAKAQIPQNLKGAWELVALMPGGIPRDSAELAAYFEFSENAYLALVVANPILLYSFKPNGKGDYLIYNSGEMKPYWLPFTYTLAGDQLTMVMLPGTEGEYTVKAEILKVTPDKMEFREKGTIDKTYHPDVSDEFINSLYVTWVLKPYIK